MPTTGDVLVVLTFATLVALTAVFFWLDWRAVDKRPDLYGRTGRYGRRGSSVWMLFALMTGFAAFLMYKALWGEWSS